MTSPRRNRRAGRNPFVPSEARLHLSPQPRCGLVSKNKPVKLKEASLPADEDNYRNHPGQCDLLVLHRRTPVRTVTAWTRRSPGMTAYSRREWEPTMQRLTKWKESEQR